MPKHLNTADDFEMVAIERLIPAPFNPNAGDFGAIHESIEANGFFGALVVSRRTRHVLAGNHRLAVALKMGYESLPVTWVDVDLDGEKRILLADNRTSRLGNDNPNALAELLAELAGTDKGLSGTGFDGDDLDQIINDLSRSGIIDQVNGADDAWVGMPEFTPGIDPLKIIISFENEADREAFAASHELQFLKKESRTWMTCHPYLGRKDLESLRYE